MRSVVKSIRRKGWNAVDRCGTVACMTMSMRLADLFADLETEMEAAESRELVQEIRERTRIEYGNIRFRELLAGACGFTVRLFFAEAPSLEGVIRDVGADWLVVTSSHRDYLIPVAAVRALRGLPPIPMRAQESHVDRRLGLRLPLRRLARSRVHLVIRLVGAHSVEGTIDRVGCDFVEVAEHPLGEVRRKRVVRDTQVVPFSGITHLSPVG